MNSLVTALLESPEPSIRYRTRVHVLGENPNSKRIRALQAEIAQGSRARALLAERDSRGRIPSSSYAKWDGAHWVMTMLAEIDYPEGDESLYSLQDQVLTWLVSKNYENGIRHIKGLARIHASIDGNAVWYLHKLGLADERVEQLVARLSDTQWPDGGWNCDATASGETSSFTESHIPLRALALHAQRSGDAKVRRAADRAAEFFLTRKLYKRQRDGRIIRPNFVQLHYPCYWHYDVLFGLKVMTEAGWIEDARCTEALDWLESKQLPKGGWVADAKFYRHSRAKNAHARSLVAWGPTGSARRNDFVTADVLTVLQAAGRFSPK